MSMDAMVRWVLLYCFRRHNTDSLNGQHKKGVEMFTRIFQGGADGKDRRQKNISSGWRCNNAKEVV